MDRLKQINPTARFVYRVSDDLRILHVSPLLIEAEKKWAPEFDLITAPSARTLDKFSHLPNTAVHPQGLVKELFDRPHKDPYSDHAAPNLISIGNMIYDLDFLDRASRLFPDWRFHVIGWLSKLPKQSNILFYGEKPFEEVIPFLKYADIGLSPYLDRPENAYLSQASHKMLQYTYCRLPIVAPHSVTDPSRPHIVGYTPGNNDSIRMALEKALSVDRNSIDRGSIPTWDAIVRDIIEYLM
jgi:2-beta-glucuronyltransferase